ncbi:HupE/UreJ family protein [Reyranella sp.]|uniref:HupE/UreJ family protein n=1 Tax=Reyranella sp. TaxID=1929291 RepID=UPI002F95BA18
MRRFLLVLLFALAGASHVEGHVTSTGLAVLEANDGRLSYRLTLVATEQDEEMGRTLLAAADGDPAAATRVAQAMREHARFSIAGNACVPERITVQGSRAGDGKVMLEMALACPKPAGTLAIRDDWPAILGGHFQTVMSVHIPGQLSVEFAFGADRREATVELSGPTATGWLSFIAMGAEHILSGPDHLLFLLALLALTRGFWPIAKIVTGFTIAHTITLSLAALGVVDVPSRVVEPLIAATIIWVALENLVAPARTAQRWLIAVVFGLVHGLGFASALTELGLPRAAMVRALIGFNVGVELGQLAFVAAVMPAVVWLAKPGRIARLPQVLSLAVAAAGAFWLVERLLFA